jgi:tRNA threonylcarbamoyladenosine biosynthesis protein TsaE
MPFFIKKNSFKIYQISVPYSGKRIHRNRQAMQIHQSTYNFYARTVADASAPGVPVLLSGPMGVGKSTFAREIVHTLIPGVRHVPSPSFPIMIPYVGPLGTLWHIDLYRLAHPRDIGSLNLYDAIRTDYCLIEWPERLDKNQLPAQYCAISLEFMDADPLEQADLWRNLAIRWVG